MSEARKQRRVCNVYALTFAVSLPFLQDVAQKKGYALAVHGSMATDLDLIACPWTEDAVGADELAEALRECAGAHLRTLNGQPIDNNPTLKPHGRQAYTFYVNRTEDGTSYGPYLDISVMPRLAE